MPTALAGILKAPLDILADKLRGYVGFVTDLQEQPEKVLAACQALAPHLLHTALAGADPQQLLPIGFWMHRSCVPFITPEQFRHIHWPTLKPIVENIWAAGHQTLFYAEGQWAAHLDAFAELPTRSIVYHVDRDDILAVHRRAGHKFCISGGVSNTLLAYGTPDEVRNQCRTIIDRVAGEGGYIMDASAIVQNDAQVENVQAMIECTREYGDYGGEPTAEPPIPPAAGSTEQSPSLAHGTPSDRPVPASPGAKSSPKSRESSATTKWSSESGGTSTRWGICSSGKCWCRFDKCVWKQVLFRGAVPCIGTGRRGPMVRSIAIDCTNGLCVGGDDGGRVAVVLYSITSLQRRRSGSDHNCLS